MIRHNPRVLSNLHQLRGDWWQHTLYMFFMSRQDIQESILCFSCHVKIYKNLFLTRIYFSLEIHCNFLHLPHCSAHTIMCVLPTVYWPRFPTLTHCQATGVSGNKWCMFYQSCLNYVWFNCDRCMVWVAEALANVGGRSVFARSHWLHQELHTHMITTWTPAFTWSLLLTLTWSIHRISTPRTSSHNHSSITPKICLPTEYCITTHHWPSYTHTSLVSHNAQKH